MSKKIVTATLSLALGLLPASCILAADGAAAPAGNNKPGTEVHAGAKPADAKQVHKDHHEAKGDAKAVHKDAKDAKAAKKPKMRWTNRRHLKHDMAEPAEDGKDAKDATDAGEGGEQAAGDEQKSSN